MKVHAVWMMAAALLAAAPASAQVVSGSVRSARTGEPVDYASVIITNEQGVVVASTQADGGGRFTVHLQGGEGRYSLRVEEPGFHAVGATFRLAPGRSFSRHFRMSETNWSASSMAERDPIGKRNGRPVETEPRGNPTFTPPSAPPR